MACENLFNEQTKAEKKRFTWKIPHFPELVKSEECIAHQKVSFQVGAGIGIPTNFTCFLKTEEVSNARRATQKSLGVSIKLAEPFPPAGVAAKVNVNLALEILSNGVHPSTVFHSKNFSKNLEGLLKGSGVLFPNILSNYTEGIPQSLLHPVNNILSVNLSVTIFNLDAKPATHLYGVLKSFKERSLQKMTQDLTTLYQEPGSWKDAPTKIVCKHGTQFKVNRGILCVRSPVFRTLFQTEMSESDKGHVKIEEIPSKALDVFLHFVHTGELKDNWNEMGILEGLTYAAHKYEFKDLFEFLELALGHLVNQENCGRLMSLAMYLGMDQAEKQLMNYFKREVTSVQQATRIMIEANSVFSFDLYSKELETGSSGE